MIASDEDAEEREWRLTALFNFVTNTGSAYPGFCRAVRGRYRATWWADTTDALVRRHYVEALGGGHPFAPSPAEVLQLAAQLEAHYRQHVAEGDIPEEKPSA
jgi:hypothetical protein